MFYLKQLGVAEWYARQTLLGAALSRRLFIANKSSLDGFSGVDATVNSSLSDTSLTQDKTQTPRALASLMADAEPANVEKTTAVKVEVEEAKTSTELARPPLFGQLSPKSDVQTDLPSPSSRLAEISHLTLPGSWLLASDGLTFVLSDVNASSQYSGESTLVENILGAMGFASRERMANKSDESPAFDVRHFAWPIFSNTKLPGNDQDTLFALMTSLIAPMITSSNVRILILGENAKKLLQEVVKSQWPQKSCFSSPISLSSMLNDPSLKSDFWLSVLESGFLKD